MEKRLFVIFTIIVAISAYYYIGDTDQIEDTQNHSIGNTKIPLPFDVVATNMTFSAYKEKMGVKEDNTVYCPKSLPKELVPIVTYSKVDKEGFPYHTMLVYDSKGDNRTTAADLVIEITKQDKLSLKSDGISKTIMINNWEARTLEEAPVGWPDYEKKYETKLSRVVEVHIGNYNYWFRASLDYTISDIVDIIKNMNQI